MPFVGGGKCGREINWRLGEFEARCGRCKRFLALDKGEEVLEAVTLLGVVIGYGVEGAPAAAVIGWRRRVRDR